MSNVLGLCFVLLVILHQAMWDLKCVFYFLPSRKTKEGTEMCGSLELWLGESTIT